MTEPARERTDRRRRAVHNAIDAARDAVKATSRPEYTGDDRCLPCTVVNAVGVAVVAVLLGRRRRTFGVFAAAVGVAAIWLRGYVIPGTPRFAPRLVAPLPIDIGPDHEPGVESASLAGAGEVNDTPGGGPAESDKMGVGRHGKDRHRDGGETDPEAVMETLVASDALVADGATLRLADGFRTTLDERIGTLRAADGAALAERAAAVAGTGVTGEIHDGRVLLDGRRDAWLSRPVAIAETAVVELLRERGVDKAVAREAARPLRAFLEACPACGGAVRDTTLRNCCGGPGGVSGDPERAVRACTDCDAVVFTEP